MGENPLEIEGAFWGLISGLLIGIVRFLWEYSYTAMPCQLEHLDQRPSLVRFHFLYFSVLLFFISSLVTIVVSLLTKPLPERCVSGDESSRWEWSSDV